MIRKVLLSIGGVIMLVVLNYGFIEDIVITDPCYYHTHKANYVFKLFYDFPAFNGSHPFPTKFNFFLTVGLGVSLGLLLNRMINKRTNSEISNLIDD